MDWSFLEHCCCRNQLSPFAEQTDQNRQIRTDVDRMFAAISRLFLRNSPRDDIGQQIEDLITLQMVDGSQWHH